MPCARDAKGNWDAHYSESDFADPQAESTFNRCKLDWSKPDRFSHAEILRLHRDLISLRKQHPSLGNCRKDLTEIQFDEKSKSLVMRGPTPSGSAALIVCNFSADAQTIPVAPSPSEPSTRSLDRRPGVRRQLQPASG